MKISEDGNVLEACAPNDFHIHLRRGKMLELVLPLCSEFGYILPMPNTDPPIATGSDVTTYKKEIDNARYANYHTRDIHPLMVIKMLKNTTPEVVREAKKCGAVGIKIYPEGVTTNSADGIADFNAIYPALSTAEEEGMVVEIHGETPHDFILDRERVFLKTFKRLVRDFPKLKFVLEHITTADAVEVVKDLPDTVAATITIHHLLITLQEVLADKRNGAEWLNPHNYCKPVAKMPADRIALVAAATSGNPKFFYGGDSAPHEPHKKESDCCCAGVFNSPVAVPLLVELFESRGKLDRLEGFWTDFGARFYGLPPTGKKIKLKKLKWTVPTIYEKNGVSVVPFYAGKVIPWIVL